MEHGKEFVSCNIFNREIDQSGAKSRKKADEEGKQPFQEDVLQDLLFWPASPVLLEEIILVNPGSQIASSQSFV